MNLKGRVITPNKIIYILFLLFVLVIEINLGKRVISSPSLLLVATPALLVGLILLKSRIATTFYILTFTPIIIIPLFKIKFASVYFVNIFLPILLIIWLVNMLIENRVKISPSPLYAPMVAFIAISILSLVNSYIFWDIAVPTTHRFLISQVGDIALKSLPILTFLIIFNYVNSQKWIRFLYLSILGIGSLGVVAVILPFTFVPRYIFVSTVLLAIAFPMALSQLLHHPQGTNFASRHKLMLLFITIGCSYAILSQDHLASIVALLAAGFFVCYMRSRKLFALVVLLTVIFSGFYSQFWISLYNSAVETGSLARIPMAMAGLQIFKKHWLLGVGPANYYSYAVAHQIGWQFWRAPMPDIHNNYLTVLIETGSLGLLALLWLISRSLKAIFSAYHATQDSFQKAFIAGAGASFAGIVGTSVAGGYLMPGVHSGAFGFFSQTTYAWILLGAALAIPRLSEDESQNRVSLKTW